MELAILSTSWRLVRAITEIVDRIEQTREDARSLKYLDTQATTFLTVVTNGLAGVDPAPYLETIASLEILYKDILKASERFIAYGRIKQMWTARKTRRNILNLNRRMRLFDTYLLHRECIQVQDFAIFFSRAEGLVPGQAHKGEELFPKVPRAEDLFHKVPKAEDLFHKFLRAEDHSPKVHQVEDLFHKAPAGGASREAQSIRKN
ncbi:hypothetical protein BD410DRAFT_845268 [Rickenella mellea]|uniref:Uncharacterized protein n=1 Tax=Rickenella mellea TaxID=50990 RepID=A0A4Y7PK00_9AGAM|nr:hypothetical protein BD410DRAFT_845268 [Rickenella mellea]